MTGTDLFIYNSFGEIFFNRKKSAKGIFRVNDIGENSFFSYRQLHKKALNILHRLQAGGMEPGDELIFQLNDNIDFISIFQACILGKIVPVPVTTGSSDEHLLKVLNIWKILKRPHLVTFAKHLEKLESFMSGKAFDGIAGEIPGKTYLTGELDTGQEKGEIFQVHKSDVAFIQFSSGSTGDPKGVVLTHENLLINTRAILESYGRPSEGEDTYLSWMPLTHDMGLIGMCLTSIAANCNLHLMASELFVRKPHLWLREISRNRVTISGSPNFGYNHVLKLYQPGLYEDVDLSSLRIIVNGAEPISIDICREFIDKMAPHGLGKNVILPAYGLAEASLAVSIIEPGEIIKTVHLDRDYLKIGDPVKEFPHQGEDKNENRVTFVEVGYPVNECSVRIVDEDGAVLGEMMMGNIQVKGGNVTSGYYHNPEENARILTTDGWLNTGDIGFLKDGRLVITGRKKDVIFVNGQNYYPHDIERVAEEVEGVQLGKVAVSSVYNAQRQEDEILCFVVFRRPLPEFIELMKTMNRHILGELALQVDKFIPVKRISRTTSGKLQRYKLRELYLDGGYDSILGEISHLLSKEKKTEKLSLPETSIEKTIADICKQVLKLETVSVTDNFFDLGATSLHTVTVKAKLEDIFSITLDDLSLFKYPTIRSLAQYLAREQEPGGSDRLEERLNKVTSRRGDGKLNREIAVIGMSGRFPGAKDLNQFWNNLVSGVESITSFSDRELIESGIDERLLNDPNYVKNKGLLEDIEYFDSHFFGYSPGEAELMDPQVRIFHECAWEALEDAGVDPVEYPGLIGLYAGASPNAGWQLSAAADSLDHVSQQFLALQLNDKDFMATRVSYKLGLTGPSYTMYTACSTSLVAVDLACQGIVSGSCDMALAGGVSLSFPKKSGYMYQEAMVFSKGGHVRAFDKDADGTVFGDGVGVVVLKRLPDAVADGDHIRAVIKSTAINNDGNRKVGYSAPSFEGQVEVISKARLLAGVEAESIGYVEAHGTGTAVGDPLEISALTEAFHTDQKGYCAIGSVKTNVGHLNVASGVASLIKTVLALEHRTIPPTLNFNTPNPRTNFAETPFYVNTQLKEWENGEYPRRAGISSFGIGGTNAHVILEEWPHKDIHQEEQKKFQLLLLSADTESALDKMTRNLGEYLKKIPPERGLADVAYTLQTGRKRFQFRRSVVCPGVEEAVELLISDDPDTHYTSFARDDDRPVVFMFSGQGAQYVNMGLDLYRDEPVFREQLDRCFEYLNALMEVDLKSVLFPEGETTEAEEKLKESVYAQPIKFAFEYAVSSMLMKWGFLSYGMIGHSAGEYVAACLCGVLSLEDALKMVVRRGQLIQKVAEGAMMSVPLPEKEVKLLFEEHSRLSLAAVNTPSLCVVSGPVDAVDALEQQLTLKGEECLRLNVPRAGHSDMFDPILEEFEDYVGQLTLNKPRQPFISCVTGTWITDDEAVDPGYWSRHLRHTVRFSDGIAELLKNDNAIFIQVGPGRGLMNFADRHPLKKEEHLAVNLIRHPREKISDVCFLLNKIGLLWASGKKIDWNGFYNGERKRRIPLPTYPFEGQCYRIAHRVPARAMESLLKPDVPPGEKEVVRESGNVSSLEKLRKRPNLSTKYAEPRDETEQGLVEIFKNVLGFRRIGIHDNFFELGGDSLKAITALAGVRNEYNVSMPVEEFFTTPTIGEIAGYVKKSSKDDVEKTIPLEPAPLKEYYDLSYAQRRLWILCQFEHGNAAYNISAPFRVQGAFDREAFEKALNLVIQRNESLRTVYVTVDGEPKQKIVPDMNPDLEVIDLRNLPREARQDEARKIYTECANRTLDLEKAVFDFKLIRLDDEEHWFILVIHHINIDGWSFDIFNEELSAACDAFHRGETPSLPPLALQYKDYSEWSNALIASGYFSKSEQYWLEKFKDKPNGLELPLDYARTTQQTFNGKRLIINFEEAETAAIRQLCKKMDTTLYMGLMALVKTLMYRYTGQEDMIIGFPIAGRTHPALERITGFLVNTLVFRVQMAPDQPWEDFLKQVRQEALACYDHQDYPFDLLVDRLELDRDLAQSPLFNVMLAGENAAAVKQQAFMGGSMQVEQSALIEGMQTCKFDLLFLVFETEEKVDFILEYNCDLFKPSTIERMRDNFLCLTKSVIKDPSLPISHLDLMAAGEYESVTRTFNDNRRNFPMQSIQSLFEKEIETRLDKTAVVYGYRHYSYECINREANRLAWYLRETYRVKPNDIIGVAADRGIEMIIAILGIIKSGAGYAAIDPNYPPERVMHMIHDSRIQLLLVDQPRPGLFRDYTGETVELIRQRDAIAAMPSHNPNPVNKPSDILYVIYTSGTTGTPNGAMLSHGILSNLVQWQQHNTTIDASLNVLQFTSINFCVSFQEIMITLCSGGTLHLIGDVERQDVEYLIQFLGRHRIEVLHLPFSYLNFLFNQSGRMGDRFDHRLKHIITAGEQLKISSGLKDFLDKNPRLQLHNHYGSSEMHVVTSYTLDAATASQNPIPPAGRPITNTQIFILDEQLNPVPVGVWGELFVAGSFDVLGYIDNRELTGKKILDHPTLSSGDRRLYRSGDLGRWQEDGNIELKGRKDSQIKIRGFRVEPGEIESRLLSIEGVKDCVLVVREDFAKQKYLAAYIVVENGITDAAGIKQIMARQLPQYMVPQLVLLDRLPLMPNGKVDRDNLPEIELDIQQNYVAPSGQTEEKMTEIWSRVLDIPKDKISSEANFFEIGGHSLKATEMVSQIHRVFNCKIPLVQVFNTPTIKALAKVIADLSGDSFTGIEPVEEKEYYPLSSAQKRLFIMQHMETDNLNYNVPFALILEGHLEPRRMDAAFDNLIRRHDSFRTCFRMADKQPAQVIHDHVDFNIFYLDSLSSEEEESVLKNFVRPFDLSRAPLLRVTVIKKGPENHLMLLDMHHIITDGTSMKILFQRELPALYAGEVLPELKLQYKDYSEWQETMISMPELKRQEAYWLKQLKGEVPILELPTDYPRPEVRTSGGDRVIFEIPAELTRKLAEVAAENNATTYLTMLSALYILLFKLAGQEDIVVGTPIAGRTHSDLYSIVGLFVNMLIMRNRPVEDMTIRRLLQEVKDTAMEAYENQDYPFDTLIEKLSFKRQSGRHALIDAVILLQNEMDPLSGEGVVSGGGISGLVMKYKDVLHIDAKFDLYFDGMMMDDRISMSLTYSTDLFKRSTAEKLTEYYVEILEQMVDNPGILLNDVSISMDIRTVKPKMLEEMKEFGF